MYAVRSMILPAVIITVRPLFSDEFSLYLLPLVKLLPHTVVLPQQAHTGVP